MSNNWKNKFLVLCILWGVYLTSCSSGNGLKTEETQDYSGFQGAYPPPMQGSELEDPYPPPSSGKDENSPYPPITENNEGVDANSSSAKIPGQGPNFEISEPVLAGSYEVNGTGPANVPIILVDVTEMGAIIGEAIINEKGEFSFVLQSPLVKSHAIGLQIGDLSSTEFNYDEFLYGDDYLDRPLIGILFDMVSVVE